jgi:hypothetical protein
LYYEHQFNSNNHYLPVHLSFPQQQQQQQQQTTMTMTTRFVSMLVALLCVLLCQQQVDAFAGQSMVNKQPFTTAQSRPIKNMNLNTRSSSPSATSSTTSLNAFPMDQVGSDMLLSATTLDPTTFFTNVLGLFLNTPIILAVPIVVGIVVAGTLAWLIVAYASPAEDN